MSDARLTRAARFESFQNLMQELKTKASPPAILTRLYNGLTAEISKAEAELKQQQNMISDLTSELAKATAAALEVRHPPNLKVRF